MSAWPSDEQLAAAERLLRVPAANGAGRRSEGAPDFFTGVNGRQRFVPPLLAERLHHESPVAVGSTAIYTYSGGVYRPHGEERLRRRIAELLGDRWNRHAADETVAFLRDSSPRLWECPPRDRINCANGILDLDTGRLERHDPEFLSPVQIAASYDPRAVCPQIEKFLGEVLATDLLPIVYELVGYLITPDNSLQRAFMFLGRGANGKSTLLNLAIALLGPQNVSAIPLHKLDEDRFASAELYGKLANVFADLDARALRSTSMFKAITGGDMIQGERKFQPPFTFRPFARLLYSANQPPPTSDSSDAFFRRWEILPFERSFKRTAQPRLLDALTTPSERSGLLNHALEALPRLATGGFTGTITSTRAADRFQADADSVAGFISERCYLEEGVRIGKPSLARAYRDWCAENDCGSLSTQRFNDRLRELVPEKSRGEVTVHGNHLWDGIALTQERGQ